MPERQEARSAAKCSRCGLTNCSCVGGYGGPLRPAPSAAATGDVTVQQALNKVGRRLDVHDVRALDELDAAFREWAHDRRDAMWWDNELRLELDAAFREWALDRRDAMWWDNELRLARAIAAVIHVELVMDDALATRAEEADSNG